MKIKLSLIFLTLATSVLLAGCQASERFSSGINQSRHQLTKTSSSNSRGSNSTYSKRATKKTPTRATQTQNVSSDDPNRDKVLKEAEKWLGTPYCWGGQDKECTDCSGFVFEIYKKCGISLPRTAAKQFFYSRADNSEDIEPGDLVFFKKSGRVTHVGIYHGANKFIHASSSKGVIISSLNKKYYRDHFAGFGKIF